MWHVLFTTRHSFRRVVERPNSSQFDLATNFQIPAASSSQASERLAWPPKESASLRDRDLKQIFICVFSTHLSERDCLWNPFSNWFMNRQRHATSNKDGDFDVVEVVGLEVGARGKKILERWLMPDQEARRACLFLQVELYKAPRHFDFEDDAPINTSSSSTELPWTSIGVSGTRRKKLWLFPKLSCWASSQKMKHGASSDLLILFPWLFSNQLSLLVSFKQS